MLTWPSYWRINFSRVEWHVKVVNSTYVKVGLPCMALRVEH